MKITTVIFDLDGTLLDTLGDLTDAVNYALTAYEMPQRSIDEIRQFVGNGIRRLMQRAVPNGEKILILRQYFQPFAVIMTCTVMIRQSPMRELWN